MSGFTVIDKTTGDFPDCEKIALEEDWAKGLCYCDIDEFAITESGNLILIDDCGSVAYCPEDRFEIIPDPPKAVSAESYDVEILNGRTEVFPYE